jgi:hypothetical protein
LFAVAMVAQFFVLDSMRVSVWFNPLACVAFVALLPVGTRPLAMMAWGLATGAFVDFMEGTAGIHAAATLFTAYTRRWTMRATLGRDAVEEAVGMPSVKLLGRKKFLRYAVLLAALHCLVYFSLEALTWRNYHLVALKTAVSGAFTFAAVWALSLLFTGGKIKRTI